MIEDTNLYSTADWNTFRSHLRAGRHIPPGSLATVHPAPASGGNNCGIPGVGWRATTAKRFWMPSGPRRAGSGATIVVAACANTRTTFGGLIAMQNLINCAKPPPIISISYGECEAENGAASNAAFSALYQQAVAEGISVFVAAGDEGAASCDAESDSATHGIGVSGFASTPYNVAVGGTDFADYLSGTNASYWSTHQHSAYGSALSYIPEIPWNDSCAGGLLSNFLGYPHDFGADGFCATATRAQEGHPDGGRGQRRSQRLRYGNATQLRSGQRNLQRLCQTILANRRGRHSQRRRARYSRRLPVRRQRLVGTLLCLLLVRYANGGAPCTGDPSNWAGAGGTSFSSPIMAGIQALVNQKQAARRAIRTTSITNWPPTNMARRDRPLATRRTARVPPTRCIFHDVTLGDIAVNCAGSANCYGYRPNRQHCAGHARRRAVGFR